MRLTDDEILARFERQQLKKIRRLERKQYLTCAEACSLLEHLLDVDYLAFDQFVYVQDWYPNNRVPASNLDDLATVLSRPPRLRPRRPTVH